MVASNPQIVREHEPPSRSTFATHCDRLAERCSSITVEQLAWIVLIVAAIATRFWNLEYRTLHHDESIHTFLSWKWTVGTDPYRHDPLSHGPFLFHVNALMYFLFGGSDAISRFAPAFTGVLLVGAPWMLRAPRFLGRWGALAAGFMLLISPSFLYYTRYIRHDPYTCLGAIALLIAIFRYVENPQRRWMILAFVSVGFMLTNHEIVFAILLVFVAVIFVTLLLGVLRPVVPVVLAAGGAGILLLLARRALGWEPFPEIPKRGEPNQLTPEQFYNAVFTHPLVIGAILLLILFVAGIVLGMQRTVPLRERRNGYLDFIFSDSAPGSLEHATWRALADPAGLAIGVGTLLFIFFSLFTSLFTNLDGIASSTYSTEGTLLYWLAQHDVRRGNQPWFYFITESFQYEWLAIVFCTAALIWVGCRFINTVRTQRADDRLFFQVFVASWFVFLFAVLSWAGEKMPWLIMHFTLPAILLSAVLLNELIEGALAWYRSPENPVRGSGERAIGPLIVTALVTLAAAWFFTASRLTYGNPAVNDLSRGYRPLQEWALDDWWLLAAFPALGLVVVIAAVIMTGSRRTAYMTITAAVIVMTLFQIHAGFRVTYLEGDIAQDTLIYNTTSPDVKQMDEDFTELSLLAFGDDSMQIGYDHCTAWPLTWYFRDNPGSYQISQQAIQNPTTLPPVVIGVPGPWDGSRGCYMPDEIEGYTSQTYIFRWHEPEYSVYRMFAIAPELTPGSSAWSSLDEDHGIFAVMSSIWGSMMTQTDPEGEQRLFRLIFFRDMPDSLNGYEYRVYVRNDLLPLYNEIRYGT